MKSESGFSIIELLISMTITGMLSALLLQFAFSYWGMGIQRESDMTFMSERLNASDFLREKIGASTGLIVQNSIADSNVGESDPLAGAQYWNIIHPTPGLRQNNSGYEPVVYFTNFSTDSANNIISDGTKDLEDEYIVYMHQSSKELRARTLVHPDSTGTNRNKTSCPPESATTACPADRMLMANVTGVNLRFFNRAGNEISAEQQLDLSEPTTPPCPSNCPPLKDALNRDVYSPDYPQVEVLELRVQATKKARYGGAKQTNSETIIRIALRNS